MPVPPHFFSTFLKTADMFLCRLEVFLEATVNKRMNGWKIRHSLDILVKEFHPFLPIGVADHAGDGLNPML